MKTPEYLGLIVKKQAALLGYSGDGEAQRAAYSFANNKDTAMLNVLGVVHTPPVGAQETPALRYAWLVGVLVEQQTELFAQQHKP